MVEQNVVFPPTDIYLPDEGSVEGELLQSTHLERENVMKSNTCVSSEESNTHASSKVTSNPSDSIDNESELPTNDREVSSLPMPELMLTPDTKSLTHP